MKANDEVTVGFAIPNHMCEYYEGLFQCGRDTPRHTCCREECVELQRLGEIKEQKMKVHHVFADDGTCVHCGDTKQ